MNSDPSIAVQRAEYAALCANPALQALLGGPAKVYDRVPQTAKVPYVTIGQHEVRDASTEDTDGAEVSSVVHAWSDESKAAAKAIAALCVSTLAPGLDLSADNQRCVSALVEEVRHLDPPDGEAFHSALTITYLTEPVG